MASVDEISELADILKPDDGEKPNGTKDVESRYLYMYMYIYSLYVHEFSFLRLNDVQTHWASICQLLDETLEQLSSVYSKVCLIEDMTQKEIEWLDIVCEAAADKTPTRGDIDRLKGEIDRHKVQLVTHDGACPQWTVPTPIVLILVLIVLIGGVVFQHISIYYFILVGLCSF